MGLRYRHATEENGFLLAGNPKEDMSPTRFIVLTPASEHWQVRKVSEKKKKNNKRSQINNVEDKAIGKKRKGNSQRVSCCLNWRVSEAFLQELGSDVHNIKKEPRHRVPALSLPSIQLSTSRDGAELSQLSQNLRALALSIFFYQRIRGRLFDFDHKTENKVRIFLQVDFKTYYKLSVNVQIKGSTLIQTRFIYKEGHVSTRY